MEAILSLFCQTEGEEGEGKKQELEKGMMILKKGSRQWVSRGGGNYSKKGVGWLVYVEETTRSALSV